MEITCTSLLAGAKGARGLAVVVDVFRAFTCTPLMFSLGIKGSILVGTAEEALDLKDRDPSLILVGEVKGAPIDGFDLGNSPSQIMCQRPGFFRDKMVVQRTSAGVQGALAALNVAEEVLLGSYVLSAATARYILARAPESVSIVAMGVQLKEKAPEEVSAEEAAAAQKAFSWSLEASMGSPSMTGISSSTREPTRWPNTTKKVLLFIMVGSISTSRKSICPLRFSFR